MCKLLDKRVYGFWWLFAVILLMGALENVSAGSQSDSLKSLRKGATALQFQIAPNFQLSSFQGAIFSGKRHFSDRSALRVGLDLKGTFFNDERDRENTVDTLTSSDFLEKDGNSQSYGVTAQYVYYPNPNPKVNVYLGSGPFVSYNRFTRDESRERQDPFQESSQLVSSSGSGWTVGLSSVLGAEWFIAKNISLSAENRFLIGYHSNKTEGSVESQPGSGNPGQEYLESKSTAFTFSPANIVLGVSAYF